MVALFMLSAATACDRNQSANDHTAPSAAGELCEHWVSGAQARKLVSAGALLLDVRTPAEYAQNHLDGALNIEVDELSTRMKEIPPEKHLVVYCQSGKRAHRAALMLKERGYTVSEIGTQAQYALDAPAGCSP
jgi:rhodanese-related sulfurtransferase